MDSIVKQTSLSIAWFSSDLCGVLCWYLDCLVAWLLYFLVDLVARVFVMAVCVMTTPSSLCSITYTETKKSVRFTCLQIYSKLIMVLNSYIFFQKFNYSQRLLSKKKQSTSIQADDNAKTPEPPNSKVTIISISYGYHLHSQVPCISVSLSESASEFLVVEYCSIHPPTHTFRNWWRRFLTCLSDMSHKCSIQFMSGLLAGQSSTFTLLAYRNAVVTRAVWLVALSY